MQKKKKAVLFLGPPGAGKGTLSALCEKEFNWKHLATGNVCREEIRLQTEIGKEIDLLVKDGKLVSDQIIMKMIEQWILNNQDDVHGIIFDGTPRTLQQVNFVHQMLQKKFPDFEMVVIHFNIDEQAVLDRILSRIVCSSKSCQAIYSDSKTSKLKPKNDMICDKCGSDLIHRSDDSQDTFKKRLVVYYQHAKDMLHYYKEHNISIVDIDAKLPVNQLFEKIKKIAYS